VQEPVVWPNKRPHRDPFNVLKIDGFDKKIGLPHHTCLFHCNKQYICLVILHHNKSGSLAQVATIILQDQWFYDIIIDHPSLKDQTVRLADVIFGWKGTQCNLQALLQKLRGKKDQGAWSVFNNSFCSAKHPDHHTISINFIQHTNASKQPLTSVSSKTPSAWGPNPAMVLHKGLLISLSEAW